MDDEDEDAGSISAASRSCSPWPESKLADFSDQGRTPGRRRGRRMSTIPTTEVDKSHAPAQRRGRPRRVNPVAAGDLQQSGIVRGRPRGARPIGHRGVAPRRNAEGQRGRLNISDAARGRLNAFTVARPRPLSKQRSETPVAGTRRPEREPSLTRQRRHEVFDAMRSEPCEGTCYAYCLADRVEIKRLFADWIKKRAAMAMAAAKAAMRPRVTSVDSSDVSRVDEAAPNYEILVVQELNKEVALLKVGRKEGGQHFTKECYVFSFGCLVCWACTPEEARCVKEHLLEFMIGSLPERDVDEDSLCIGSRDGWLPPEVPVSSHDPPTFERIALAYALAQSVRLGSLEIRIERCIARTRHIPETMARTGHVELTSRELGKMVGELFVLRNQVNLHTDILDTPDILWDHGDYEPFYLKCRQHLDMEKRISILNQRFEVLQDMFDALEDELNERQGTRLEWVIIVLCAVEALVMALRLYTRVVMGHSISIGTREAAFLCPILGPLGYIGHLFKTLLLEA